MPIWPSAAQSYKHLILPTPVTLQFLNMSLNLTLGVYY
jgi:hypothetical protein